MNAIRKGIAPLFGVFLLAGCAVQRYRPAPIVARATASAFASRPHCPRGRPRLGIYKRCRLPLCISVPHSSRLARALRERKHLSLQRALAPIRH